MKNNLNLEIKRLLNLAEAKSRDVRPLLYERENFNHIINEEGEEPIDLRQRFSQMLMNNEMPGCTAITNFGKSGVITKEQANAIQDPLNLGKQQLIGQEYAKATCQLRNGSRANLAVFNIEAKGRDAILAIKLDTKGGETNWSNSILGFRQVPGLLETGKELYIADKSNLSVDQENFLQNLLDNSTQLTGSKIFAVIPDGEEPNNYEPVDLITGKGINNGQQYIDPSTLNPDGLTPAFKKNEYNKFIAYVKKATKNVEMDLRQQIELALSKDYTTNESKFAVNPDGSPKYTGENPVENPQGANDPRIRPANLSTDPTGKYGYITLQQWCSVNETQCHEGSQFKEYITLYADKPLKLYPLKTQAMMTRDAGETALSKGQSKRADKQGAKDTGITRENCRAAYNLLLRVVEIPFENDQQFEDQINRSVSSVNSYPGTNAWLGGNSKINTIKNILNDCKYGSNIGNNFKKKLATDAKLNSDHPASLASDRQSTTTKTTTVNPMKTASELSESISRSLRKVLKEHTKTNNDYMIKKSVRKNLRRLL
jgi:hypothetical protein